jgi:L-aminopeptidase/D-esterase-like protein
MDGDTLFALATGECEQTPNPMLLSAMTAQAVALACVNAVQSASGLRLGSRWWPSAREL